MGFSVLIWLCEIYLFIFDDFDIGCLIRVSVYDFQIWVFFGGFIYVWHYDIFVMKLLYTMMGT